MRRHPNSPKRQRTLGTRREYRIEQLEDRHLLAGEHVFAVLPGEISEPGTELEIPITLAAGDFRLRGGEAYVGIYTTAAAGSGFDAAAVSVESQTGERLQALRMRNDLPGSKSSLTLVNLEEGVYRLQVRGENGSTGAFEVSVFLAGDVSGDGVVSARDMMTLRRQYGARIGDSRYTVDADADLDGRITALDLAMGWRNLGDRTSIEVITLGAEFGEGALELSNGALGTRQDTIDVLGESLPGQIVQFDVNGDGIFDDGQTVADDAGTFHFDVPLSEGENQVRVEAHDSFGQRREAWLQILKDSIEPGLEVDLAEATDSGAKGDFVTMFESVRLIGQSEPGARVIILETGDSAIVDSRGQFTLGDVTLAIGANSFTVVASDRVGNDTTTSLNIVRAQLPAESIVLTENGMLLASAMREISLAQPMGSRVVTFEIDANFDRTDGSTATGDRLLVYLVNPNNPTQTLLSNGAAGTAVFSLTEQGPEFTPGLVRFDGRTVELDVTSLIGMPSGQLLFQLLSGDDDTGSTFVIHAPTYQVDETGSASPTLASSALFVEAGSALDLTSFSTAADVEVAVGNARYDQALGLYTAELSLRNNGPAMGRRAVVAFPSLPTGATLRTLSSITANAAPYINMTSALPPGGLEANKESSKILVQFEYAGDAPFALRPAVLSAGSNHAPELESLGPYTVPPGGKLAIELSSTDPDGDPITYSLKANGDLPTGKFVTSGKLEFMPSPEQLGTYEFTLFATDGIATTSQDITLHVVPDAETTTRISGRILDVDGTPLVGVPVSLARISVLTDADGRFILELPPTLVPTEDFSIVIPTGDPQFDPFGTGQQTISFRRARYDLATGTSEENPRRHPNLVTSFIDASIVYGSDETRAHALRSLSGGKLKSQSGPDGELLPQNNAVFFPDGPLENDLGGLADPTSMFVAGDVRASENVALAAIHTILLREHNRLAEELAASNPQLSDEALYQQSRRLVTAELQHITYAEYLPLLLGENAIPAYAGYRSDVDPTTGALFTTAAFRIGHSQMVPTLSRLDASGNDDAAGPLPLQQAFFATRPILEDGIESILRGLAVQQAQQVDTRVIDELRNFLFGPPGSGGMDLPSMSIQRGRDLGLPSYTEARVNFGLPPITAFSQITTNAIVQAALQSAYQTVDKIDAFVGLLAEDHVPGAMVGPLAQAILSQQFARSRDGDRFWYENEQFSEAELNFIRGTKLSDLIERNTTISGLPEHVLTIGTVPTAPGPAGSAATSPPTEYRTIDGSGNNPLNPVLGSVGTHLRIDGSLHYADGLSSPAGSDRPLARSVSNAVLAQSGSVPNSVGATTMMVFFGQLLSHDLALSPTGATDTLKFHADQVEIADKEYPFVAEKFDLMLGHAFYEGVNNVIARPVYLPAIDVANQVTIDPQRDVMVTTDAIPGASVMVKQGTLRTREGTLFEQALSITEVPPGFTPAALPENLLPDLVVTIQPAEMVFTTPAPLTLPNRAGYAAGTTLDLWSINPVTGFFDDVGDGVVSADGSIIETADGGIRNSSWHFFALQEEEAELVQECLMCPCDPLELPINSSVNMHSGVLSEVHALSTYQSLGTSRGVVLYYNSLRANPQPLVQFSHSVSSISTGGANAPEQFLAARMTIGDGNLTYQVSGFEGGGGLPGGEHFWRISAPGDVSGTMMADLRALPSGKYTFELSSGLLNRSTSGTFSGSLSKQAGTLVNANFIDSPFGSGWGIVGLQEVIENADGSVLLVDGGGHNTLFEVSATAPNYFDSPTGDFSIFERTGVRSYRRTLTDKTIYAFENGRLVTVTDRNGNETLYEYNDFGIQRIIDPVGLATVFQYSAGKVTSITDPAGRVTAFEFDERGNLRRITDPDSSSRTWSYDTNHLMTSELDKRGFISTVAYNDYSRAVHGIRADSSNVFAEPSLTRGVGSFAASHRASTALPASNTQDIGQYANGNGHVTRFLLDDFGQLVSSVDDLGPGISVRRDAGTNLVSTIVNARGHETALSYDVRGNLLTQSDAPTDTETATAFWARVADGGPSPRTRFAIAYDSSRDETLIFGGRTQTPDLLTNETWIWDGQSWIKREVAGPPASDRAAMAFDSLRNEVVMVIGVTEPFAGRQTWLWNGTSWRRAANPPSFWGHSMAFDTQRGVTVLFGGAGNENRTWEWNGLSWQARFPANRPNTGSDSHSMTYDSARQYVLLVANTPTGTQTWSYNGTNWNLLDTNGPQVQVGGGNHQLTFDVTRGVAVLFASGPDGPQTWEWDGTTWEQRLLPPSTPAFHSIAISYDSQSEALVLFAGHGQGGAPWVMETWEARADYTGDGSDGSTGLRTFTYDATYSQPTSFVEFTQSGSRQTIFEVDSVDGNRISMTRVVGSVGGDDDVITRYSYLANGLVDTMTDPLGRVTDYDYNSVGRLIHVTYAKGTEDEAIEHYEYDMTTVAGRAGLVTATVDGNGHRTEYEFDVMNRLTRTIEPDPDGSAGPLGSPLTQFNYDNAGNLIETIDARANVTTSAYDPMDRLIRRVDPDPDGDFGLMSSPVTRFGYDAAGNLVTVVDPLSHATLHDYDARNRRIRTVDPDNGATQFRYDVDNNLTVVIDAPTTANPEGNETRFIYDRRNRLIREIDPFGERTEYRYDASDNVTEKTDRNGRVTRYIYDDLNRLTTETWLGTSGNGNVVNYGYDKVSNLTSVYDVFSSLGYTYNDRNRVKTVDNRGGEAIQGTPNVPRVVLTYSYDDVGNVLSVADTISGSAGATTGYVYDNLDRLITLTQAGSGLSDKRADFAYNPLGQYVSINRYRDLDATQLVVGTRYTYDALNRLDVMRHQNASGETLNFHDLDYDAASRITRITDIDGTHLYTYDDRNQLTGADHTATGGGEISGLNDENYQYDANGNRLESHLHGTGYVTGPGNRLLSDGTYNYEYDDEGNTVVRTRMTGTQADGSTIREFIWDHRNRLVAVIDKLSDGTPTQEVRFTYDVLDRRISKSVGTTPLDAVDAAFTHFVYDREDVILDFIDADGTGPASVQLDQRYLHGPGIDQVLAQDNAAGTVHWHLTDHLGTVKDLADDAGVLANHIVFDSYGNVESQTSPVVESRYLFTGREWDNSVVLTYYRSRYFSNMIGRFISDDILGFTAGDANMARYVANQPIRFDDPGGTTPKGPHNTTYRADFREFPEPDLHIYHNQGETIVSSKGGYRRGTHRGQELVPLPKSLRAPYGKIINDFLKKAKKIVEGASKGLRCVAPITPTPLDLIELFDGSASNWGPNDVPILTPFGVLRYTLQPGDPGYAPDA